MRILLWINRHKNGKPDTCVLKIAEQRLLGLPRSDRRGETYWRFDELLEKTKEEIAPQTSFKCDDCKVEVVVIGSDDYNEEIKQRAKLKQELAQMESVENKTKSKAPEQPEAKVEKQKSEEKNPPRQALKEQIAQAIQENKQAEQLKESNETNSNQPINN